MSREMKDSEIEWIGEIPKEWNLGKISSIFHDIGSGTTPKSGEIQYYNGEYYWIQSGDINGTIISGTSKTITQLALNDISALKLYKPDFIVIAMYGASIGNIAISNITACVNQACCVLSEPFYNLKYIFYCIKASKDYIVTLASGGTQPNISQEKIKQIKLPIPSNIEQQKIADFLDESVSAIDNIITQTAQSIEQYKKYKQSLITEAVTKGLNPDVEMKDSGIEWIGKVPKHWNIVRLKNIGICFGGVTYNPTDICEEDEGVLVLRSSNVQNGKLDFCDNVYVRMNISEKYITRKGDILVCSRNGSRNLIGKNALINKDYGYTFGAFMTIVRTKYYEFIHYFLNSSIFEAQSSLFLTSTVNQLTLGVLNNMKLVLPNEEEQKQIVNYLNEKCNKIDNLISQKELLLTNLESYKKSLIYECVTGKIEVK